MLSSDLNVMVIHQRYKCWLNFQLLPQCNTRLSKYIDTPTVLVVDLLFTCATIKKEDEIIGTVTTVQSFQRSFLVVIITHSAVFWHLPSHSWVSYSNWSSWIIFHHLTRTWSNTPPPTQLLTSLTVLFSVWMPPKTVATVSLHQAALARTHT